MSNAIWVEAIANDATAILRVMLPLSRRTISTRGMGDPCGLVVRTAVFIRCRNLLTLPRSNRPSASILISISGQSPEMGASVDLGMSP